MSHQHIPTSLKSEDDIGEEYGRGAIGAYPRHASTASSSSAASATATAAPASSSQRHSSSRSEAQKERVTTACTYCRFRKVKCDGGLPSCSFCHHMGRASECEYAKVSEEENQQLRKRKRELRARRAAEKEQQRQQRKEGGGSASINDDRRQQQQQQRRGLDRAKPPVSPTFTASASSSSAPTVLSQPFPSSSSPSMHASLSGLPAELANTISPHFLAFLPSHSPSAAGQSHRDVEHADPNAQYHQHVFPSYTEQQQQQHRQYNHHFHAPPPPQQRSPTSTQPGQPFPVFQYDRPSGALASSFRPPAAAVVSPSDAVFRSEHGAATAPPAQQHFPVESPVLDWSFRSFRPFPESSIASDAVDALVPTALATSSSASGSASVTEAKEHGPTALFTTTDTDMGATGVKFNNDVDSEVALSTVSSLSTCASPPPSTSPCSTAWSSTTSPTLAHVKSDVHYTAARAAPRSTPLLANLPAFSTDAVAQQPA